MTRSALILAAHGSAEVPLVNAHVQALAHSLAREGRFDEVRAAFHQGEPRYCSVLDASSAEDVTVVPLMTSEGHFSQVVLPRELGRNRRYAHVHVRRTAPVGTHPGLVEVVGRRLQRLMRRYGFRIDETSLAIVGHGSSRHAGSRVTTETLAGRLRQRRASAEVLLGLLDEDPPLDTLVDRASAPCVVVIPFLIGSGLHAAHDLPRRLGLNVDPGEMLPYIGRVRGRSVVCDAAVGSDAEIARMVTQLACGRDVVEAETPR